MRQVLLSLSVVALLAHPAAGLETLPDGFEELGLDVRRDGVSVSPEGITLSGVTISGPRARLRAESMSWQPGTPMVTFASGRLLHGEEGGPGSAIGFERLELSSPKLLMGLVSPVACGAVPAGGETLHLSVRRLSLVGGRPLDDVLQPVERMDIADLGMGILHDPGQACLFPTGASLTLLAVTSADRSRLHVGSAEGTVTPRDGSASAMTARIDDVLMLSPDGQVLAGLETLSLALSSTLDGRIDISADRILDMVMQGESAADLVLSGLDVPAWSLVKDRMPEGQAGPERTRVDATLAIRHAGASVSLDIRGSASGLGDLHADADLLVLPASRGIALGQMFGDRFGRLDILERLALSSLTLEVRNDGATALAEALTGVPPGDALERLSRRLRAAPEDIRSAVMDFLWRAVDGEAALSLEPESPVTAPQAIMTALVRPGRLIGMLGLAVH